jgi:hypothetical protein
MGRGHLDLHCFQVESSSNLAVDHVHAAAVRDRFDQVAGTPDLLGVRREDRSSISICTGWSHDAPTHASKTAARNWCSRPPGSLISPQGPYKGKLGPSDPTAAPEP